MDLLPSCNVSLPGPLRYFRRVTWTNIERIVKAGRPLVLAICLWLSINHARGSGIERTRAAAAAGDLNAQVLLARAYFRGEGVPQDDGKALELYREAARKGHAEAQNALGFMHGNGRGVPLDERAALEWFHKAAEQGHAAAQFKFGLMHARGRGTADFQQGLSSVDAAAARRLVDEFKQRRLHARAAEGAAPRS